jgi:hypothetical protein
VNPAHLLLGAEFFKSALLALSASFGPGPAQPALEGEVARFAAAWDAGDLQVLGKAMRAEGIGLHLQGEEHVSIKPKQAQAALRSFLDRYPGGESEVTKTSTAGGDPVLGFAEITWRTRAPGLPDPVIFSLFVGYALEGDTWRVTEIRVFY